MLVGWHFTPQHRFAMNTSQPSRQHQGPAVAAILIAQPDERDIASCLARLAPFLDELVIVCADSSDRTARIAREYGARVYANNSIGAADLLDFCRSHVTAQWHFVVDVRDRLAERDLNCIREAIKRAHPGAVSVTVQRGAPAEASLAPLVIHRRTAGAAQKPSADDEQVIRIDVIVLSNAKTKLHHRMTCDCLRTLRDSEPGVEFNVVVVETNTEEAIAAFHEGPVYGAACRVVFPGKPFNYNEFLQIGFTTLANSPSPYLLIANNDVLFQPGFATALVNGLRDYGSVGPRGRLPGAGTWLPAVSDRRGSDPLLSRGRHRCTGRRCAPDLRHAAHEGGRRRH